MKLNKKGFTIVELVIVIAVIAILAAVLIPTFSKVIANADESAAMQACSAAYDEAYSEVLKDGKIEADETATSNGFSFKYAKDGASCIITYTGSDTKLKDYTYTIDASHKVTATKAS